MNPYKYDRELLVAAVSGSGGVLRTIANRLGIDRTTLWHWRNTIPEVQEIIAEELESTLDKAESKLLAHVEEGELKAITYLLSTKGKSRGFTTKVENDIKGSLETTGRVTVYLPDNQRDVPAPKVNLSDT